MPIRDEANKLGLPPRIFYYTPDQVAYLLQVPEDYVREKLLFYDVRDPGIAPKSKMRAINIAPEGETPVWRISEAALVAFLKRRGVKFYERGYMS